MDGPDGPPGGSRLRMIRPSGGADLPRCAHFFLQRQAHHWGNVTDEQADKMRTIVGAMCRPFTDHEYIIDIEH